MTDEDDVNNEAAPFARAYDFFKHMTGVALVSIGGVFAFVDGQGPALDMRRTIIVLACLGIAGATSLLMASALATLDVKPVPRETMARSVRLGLITATFFLAAGLGAFIQTFSSAMLK